MGRSMEHYLAHLLAHKGHIWRSKELKCTNIFKCMILFLQILCVFVE